MADADKSHLVEELRKRMQDMTPLEEEPDFINKEETLWRFLKARDWDIKEAEKQLRGAVEWRREYKPLTVDCKWCHESPGYHSMRQVGFDELGRPVVYSSFIQAEAHKNSPEDSIAHITYLIENAKKTMKPGVTTWVWVIDCTGMTLPACNPKLGYGCTQILSNYYPERMGMTIMVNHNAVFAGVYKAVKLFLQPATANKVQMVRSKQKISELFDRYFPEELTQWLMEEMKLNKAKKMSDNQRYFWRPPGKPADHDPRGCPSYVSRYIDAEKSETVCNHSVHPNIDDWIKGNLQKFQFSKIKSSSKLKEYFQNGSNNEQNGATASVAENDDEDDFENQELDIPEEFRIPVDAEQLK